MTNTNPNNSSLSSASRHRKILIGGIVVLLLITSGWVFFFQSSRNKNPSSLRRVKIAQAGDFFLYAPLYVAVDAGFFEKQGLSVSITTTGGDEKTWAAVVSRDVSFGIADPTFVAISDARGQPGKVIASIVNGVPFWGVTLNPSIPKIVSPKDLASYSVATFPSPSTAFTLQRQMFLEGGLKPNIREGAFGTLLTMLQSGQADIALELEPNVSQAAANGARVIYSLADLYGDFAVTGLATTPELLSKEPEFVGKVVCALQTSLDFMRTHPAETLSVLEKRFPEIKQEIAKEALERVIAARIIPEDLTISTSAWNKAIQLRKDAGDIAAPKNIETYVDNSFAERAKTNCRAK
jgi:NitT/TauT family transport system substrate-binding protein